MRKLMSMYKALHPKDDVGRLDETIKERGKSLASIEECLDIATQQLKTEKKGKKKIQNTTPHLTNTKTDR